MAHLSLTGRLWEVIRVKEVEEIVRGNIKPAGGIIVHGVQWDRLIKYRW